MVSWLAATRGRTAGLPFLQPLVSAQGKRRTKSLCQRTKIPGLITAAQVKDRGPWTSWWRSGRGCCLCGSASEVRAKAAQLWTAEEGEGGAGAHALCRSQMGRALVFRPNASCLPHPNTALCSWDFWSLYSREPPLPPLNTLPQPPCMGIFAESF